MLHKSSMKKKLHHGASGNKRKKLKVQKTEEDIITHKPEILEIQNLREGMVLLGCVTEIRSKGLQVSLPGCLVGMIPISKISRKLTEVLLAEDDSPEPSLQSIISVGSLIPCKVIQIVQKEGNKKSTVILSSDPGDVNSDLRAQSIYKDMVLHATVMSVEDHGYVMDIGIKNVQAFLPFTDSFNTRILHLGQIIPTCVKKPPTENVVWLKELSFNDSFPQIENENMKLASIVPGTSVVAYITEIKQPFIHLRCMNFQACANSMSFSNAKKLSEGAKVSGTVLYVHPVTHIIYLLLSKKCVPDSFQKFFKVQKYDLIQNAKYQYSFYTRVLFSLGKGMFGFLRKQQLSKKSVSFEALGKNPTIPKVRVVYLHFMDNIAELSLNPNLINMTIKKEEEMQIAEFCEGVVKNHLASGMIVSICPGLTGFVRKVQISDSLVSQPEKLHPVKSQVQCRVLYKDPLGLTCKESFLKLDQNDVLQSYSDVQHGSCFKGVIVQKSDKHVLVLFFNNVKGIVTQDHIPPSSLLFVGQTVMCQVLHCDPARERLRLSLKCDMAVPKRKLQTVKEKQTSKEKKATKKQMTTNSENVCKKNIVTSLTDEISKDSQRKEFSPKESQKAVVKTVAGHQLNIIVDGSVRGRVHVTEIGDVKEGEQPLRRFSAGQRISVHVLNSFDSKSHNFLQISHQNYNTYMECSLQYPPPIVPDEFFAIGKAYTAFVKEINRTCATLWLSPYQTGTLEYLHFSNNPKILRRLKKTLKLGQAVKVSVLKKQKRDKQPSEIILSKTDIKAPEVGQNVTALVQIVSFEKGVVVKLPHGYHGFVALADLQDVYSPVGPLLTKCKRLFFIRCHVLGVDHDTQYCQLSLRKSRLYQKFTAEGFCPEITLESLEEGKLLKGIVKSSADNNIVVSLGCNLDGKVALHSCPVDKCANCKKSQKISNKNIPGSVIEVVVDGATNQNVVPLTLPEFASKGISGCTRLTLTEDINWDEV